jgi:hypothetical protein
LRWIRLSLSRPTLTFRTQARLHLGFTRDVRKLAP